MKKRVLTVVLSVFGAGAFFAQTDSTERENDIEQVVLTGVADIAKDRKTPVAVSTIKETVIVEKLGNQEFPEILNTTPSVYATKSGGGFGDSRINVRGFDQRNTAVMINGVPVNDMENGAVYWSNWAGLSDVTSAMQVQRGLGSSKLAIASVGGTINVLTRAADKKRQGNFSLGFGNDGYNKQLFSYNTGKLANGLATSFLLSRTSGSMYADGTQFEGYNYYWALGYQPSAKHDLQFTITGAPQWHHQRSFQSKISDYILYGGTEEEPNRKYNQNWGYLNGEEYSMTRNYYHKPVMSLNWDFNITDATKLNSVVYASFGRGGGTGDAGRINGKFYNQLPRTADGLVRFDDIVAWNQGTLVPDFGAVNKTPMLANSSNGIIRRSSINSHNWFGAITSLNHKFNENFNVTAGLDGRTYRGIHYRIASDLLGNSSYTDNSNVNNRPNVISNTFDAKPSFNPFGGATNDIDDQLAYSNDGIVKWLGAFSQLEYSKDALSAFLQGSVSNQGFQRVDYMLYTPENQESEKVNLTGFNVKGGANYNINENHNVFFNTGYYERQPFFGAVFINNTNTVNPDLVNEKVASYELGYGYRSGIFNANLNLYSTSWDDIYRRITSRVDGVTYPTNVLGIEEIHNGVEFDFNVRPHNRINVNGMFSAGNWFYKGNPTATFIDDQTGEVKDVKTLYLDGLKVGDAAQLTAALGSDFRITDWFNMDLQYRYADNLYSSFEPANRTSETGATAVKLPAYGLFDLGTSFKWNLPNAQAIKLRANINNLFDTVYIAESRTSLAADANEANNWNGINKNNEVFFGFGRTWNATLSYNF